MSMKALQTFPPLSRLISSLPSARRVHGVSARWVAGFGIVHLLNHLLIPFGPEAYTRGQSFARWLYRTPIVEPFLVALVLAQAVSGVRLLWVTRQHPHKNSWQRWSGGFLSFFLVVHTGAALVQRFIVGLETNFYWAAAVLAFPTVLFFVPYYVLGSASFLVHFGIALRRGRVQYWLVAGLVLAALVLAGLAGWFAPVQIPVEYRFGETPKIATD
jgi:hypothetical protein